MHAWIKEQLLQFGWPVEYLPLGSHLVGLLLIALAALLGYYLAKHRVLTLIQTIVHKTRNTWDDRLVEHQVFTKTTLFIPFIIIVALTPHLLPAESSAIPLLLLAARIAIIFQVARVLDALLNVIKSSYQEKAKSRYVPLNATIQLIKLAIYLIAVILAVSAIIDRSPVYLLSGLGALTAVLLLVFQDTIKGLVASIQISANKMVAPGDWVELPQYGADGDVLEIGLNTVKIQNFDRTVTTVPTYALISGSFKNWRDMFNSGGRRIKRAIYIDVVSIRFYQPKELEKLKRISLLTPYIDAKLAEIDADNQERNLVDGDKVNQRHLTNVGTFRAYVEAYLKQHRSVHRQMTCMVRQLAPTPTGLPLELYFFSNDQNWVNYEGIQADVFDHLYAIAAEFDLRIFQHPTGLDWQGR